MSNENPIAYHIHSSPVGDLLMGGRGGLLNFLHFPNSSRRREIGEDWIESKAPFHSICEQLDAYFAKELRVFDVAYELDGTDFQKAVWEALARIPYGEIKSYGAIAKEVSSEGASRAVGMANNANPLPIVIPCHRVIGSSGKLVGFGGGMDVKIQLLELEGIRPAEVDNPGQMAFSF